MNVHESFAVPRKDLKESRGGTLTKVDFMYSYVPLGDPKELIVEVYGSMIVKFVEVYGSVIKLKS